MNNYCFCCFSWFAPADCYFAINYLCYNIRHRLYLLFPVGVSCSLSKKQWMCLPTISCRIQYFDLANTGQPLLRCIIVSLDSPRKLHIGDSSWPSIRCFIEFTCHAFSCFAHTIASVSFLRCTHFIHCHVISILTFCISFRILHLSGFSRHCPLFSAFKRFSNSFKSSSSDSTFSPAANFSSNSLLSLRYFPRLWKTNPFSSSFSCKIQSTFSLRCILPFMVINFLVLMLILFYSSSLQCNTPAP